MKTDDLIRALAADSASVERSVSGRLGIAALIGGIIAALGMSLAMGVRPDVMEAFTSWPFLTKLAIVWLAVIAGFMIALRLASPLADQRALRLLAPVVLAIAVAVGVELSQLPAEFWGVRLLGKNALVCLVAIPALSLVPLAAGIYAMRAGAPASPGLAGGAVGLLAAAIAAAAYALHCTDDSPLFVAFWYTLATLIVTALGCMAGQRLLRW